MVLCKNIKIPDVKINCCGVNYYIFDSKTSEHFRAFFHKNIHKTIAADICLTIWMCCKINSCIHAITFYYNAKGEVVAQTKSKKINYIMKLQKVFLENATIKSKNIKNYDLSNRYLWKYGKSNDGKTQYIYDFNDRKVDINEHLR